MVPLKGGKDIGEVRCGRVSGKAPIPFGSLHYKSFKGRLDVDNQLAIKWSKL
jgi:hypothetical protein